MPALPLGPAALVYRCSPARADRPASRVSSLLAGPLPAVRTAQQSFSGFLGRPPAAVPNLSFEACRLFGDEGTPIHGRTMAEVWHGEYFQKARQRIIDNDMPDFCVHCNANEVFENNLIREGLKKHIEADKHGRNR